MKKLNEEKGITLIALVITIIVLLILAGVSIAALSGNNGILTKAKEAKIKTESSSKAEQRSLTALEAAMNTEVTEFKGTLNGEEKTVKIPAGFAVSQIKGENTIEGGLVIVDKDENEFVWVPVEFSDFKRLAGYRNGGDQDCTFTTTGLESGKYYEPTADGTANATEVEKMYKSVKDNGGFYIARYETGKETGDIAVSKKNAEVWNYIKWGNSMEDETEGAVAKARNFASQHGYTRVTSTLCYGVQWDAAMTFIDSDYLTHSCKTDSFVKNSTEKGWYSDNYSSGNPTHKTGIDVGTGANCVNNIYDLGGNVYEWTMESYHTDGRVVRGGDYGSTSSNVPASYRGNYDPTSSFSYIGFRLTLFL